MGLVMCWDVSGSVELIHNEEIVYTEIKPSFVDQLIYDVVEGYVQKYFCLI